MKVVIIGAGLAGLSAAYHLRGNWIILEKENKVGGLAGSDHVSGFIFDKTGHLMHMHNPYTKSWLIEGLLKDRLNNLRRSSWIYSKDVFTRYPFQANTYGLPAPTIADCVASFLKTRDRVKKTSADPNFKRWCLEAFGPGISKNFMVPYNEKLWRTDLTKMTTEWIRYFVPVPSREEVLYGALTDQKKYFGYNSTFYYPKEGGIQTLPDALAGQLSGSEIYLSQAVIGIDLAGKMVVTTTGIYPYDWLINTAPLSHFLNWVAPQLPSALSSAKDQALNWTIVYNLNLGISNPRPTDKHWVYFPEKKYPFYRIGICSNFSENIAPSGTSSYYVEFARRPREAFDYGKMLAQTITQLRQFGWMRPGDEMAVAHWSKIDPAYVIFNKERRRFLPALFKWLLTRHILSIGRYGAWKYSFMEEAILDGKAAAEKILRQ